MTIQIGTISFDRPSDTIRHSDIEHILALSGKEVIRLAWNSLAPYKCRHYEPKSNCKRGPYGKRFCTQGITRKALAEWFCQFFNLERNKGQGNACIDQLVGIGLLKSYSCISEFSGLLSDTQYYATACAPEFDL